jgi:hypothetical protein
VTATIPECTITIAFLNCPTRPARNFPLSWNAQLGRAFAGPQNDLLS